MIAFCFGSTICLDIGRRPCAEIQLARQWRVLRLIEASQAGLSVAEITEETGISLRTVYRDLEALQEAGFPLYSERVGQAQKWAFVDAFKFQLPQPFSLTELMSLQVYSDLIKAFKGTAFYDGLESVFAKIRATLPPQARTYLKNVQSGFSVGLKPYKEYGRFKGLINQLDRAMTKQQTVTMAYKALSADKETTRRVDPYRVWFFNGTIYLIGHCHLRGEVRMFVLDRIRFLEVTEAGFDIPEDFDLDDYLGHSFGVMRGDPVRVKIRISSQWADYMNEKIWHDSQETIKQEDGSLLMTFTVAGTDEIKRWVMGLGGEAEILEPPELRDEMKEQFREILDRYEIVPRSLERARR